MDFLDPKKQRRHTILLISGYVLIGVAIIISTIVLVYQANGFGVNRQGQVVQNGLLFFSSQPTQATIHMSGKQQTVQTNSRLNVAAGSYDVRLSRDGYRDWNRPITVQGGDVQNFDYPLLFPRTLQTDATATFGSTLGIVSQSRDRRWLVVQQTPQTPSFAVYDLNAIENDPITVTLPNSLYEANGSTHTWEVVQWANDNARFLLKHTHDAGVEYIVAERTDATRAVNVSQTITTTDRDVTLIDNRADRFYLHNTTSGLLQRASLNDVAPQTVLEGVISFKSYGDDTVVYATKTDADKNKTLIGLYDNERTYPIRQVAADTTYLLDMAGYKGRPYVVVSAASENAAYIYQDPARQLRSNDKLQVPAALRALRVDNPGYIGFSLNTQFIVAQGGTSFAVYDLHSKDGYRYTVDAPLDAPQVKATWMDGHRLNYISGGQLTVFDYDQRNQQTLVPAAAQYLPFYTPDYEEVFTIAQNTQGVFELTRTSLLTEADQ